MTLSRASRPGPAPAFRASAAVAAGQSEALRRVNRSCRERLDDWAVVAIKVMIVLSVVLQRLQLPGGVPVTLVVLVLGAALLSFWGAVRVSGPALLAFLGATTAMALTAWLAAQREVAPSMTSYLLLLALYAPWVLRARDTLRPHLPELARLFVGLTGVLGVVALAQLLAQYAHVWQFADYLGQLPTAMLVPGYNSVAEFSYGSGIYRPQAFVYLEPSMLSQTSALGILVGLATRARLRALIGPGMGLFSALSGTGIMLLAVGVGLMLCLRPRLLRPSFLVAIAVGAVAMLLSPFAGTLLDRSDEIGQTGSSGSLRFLDPYTQVLAGLAEDPVRVLIGAGPGTSERLLATNRGSGLGQAVVYIIPAKLLFEYGALAGLAFLLFLLASLLVRSALPLIGASVTFMIMFLSGALLQPNTVLLAWLLVVIWSGWSRPPPDPTGGPPGASFRVIDRVDRAWPRSTPRRRRRRSWEPA